MGEPAYQLPDDDKPDIRPHLRSLEGGGESTPPARGHLRSVSGDTKSSLAHQESLFNADKADRKASLGQKGKSVLQRYRGLRGNAIQTVLKHKWLVGFGFGCVGIGTVLMIIILLLGSLKIPHLAENITSYQFARVFQQAQENNEALTTEKIAVDAADDSLYSKIKNNYETSKGKVKDQWSKLDKYRPNKVLENMGSTEQLKFNYQQTALGRQKLVGITMGNKSLLVQSTPFKDRLIPGYKFLGDIKLAGDIQPALTGALHANDIGPIVRGLTAKEIRQRLGISLTAWVIAKYQNKDATAAARQEARDAVAKIQTDNSSAATTQSLNDAEQKVKQQSQQDIADDSKLDQMLKNGGRDPAVEQIMTDSAKTSGFDTALSWVNPVYGVAMPACIIFDGSMEHAGSTIDANSAAQMKEYQYIASAADQEKDGTNASATAVGALNNRLGDITNSAPMERASGSTTYTTDAIPSAQASSMGTFTLLNSLFKLIPGPDPSTMIGAVNAVSSKTCAGLTNTYVAVGLGVVNGVLAIVSLGSSEAGEESVAQAFRLGIQKIASNLGEKVASRAALKEAAAQGTGKTIGFLGDSLKTGAKIAGATLLAKWIVGNQSGYLNNGLDTNTETADHADAGGNLMANEIEREQFYGRPLNASESSDAVQQQAQYVYDQNASKATYQRYFALSNPMSLLSVLGTSISGSFYHFSITNTLQGFAAKLANPITTMGHVMMGTNFGLAYAAVSPSDQDHGNVQWGWSKAEQKVMKQPSYKHLKNQEILDASGQEDAISSKYGKCFDGSTTQGTLLQDGDIQRDDSGNVTNDGDCSPADLSIGNPQYCYAAQGSQSVDPNGCDLVFRWRLAQRYDKGLDTLLDEQTITSDNTASTTSPGAQFRIASFNVQGAVHTPNSWQARMQRSVTTITQNQLQIVGLQEFEKPQRDYLMSKIGDQYSIYPQTADYGAGNPSVNSIIWKSSDFTLVKGGTQPNLRYFGGNNGAPLNAPWVLLKSTSGQEFYVLNTHDPAHPQYSDLRYQNALQHVQFIQQLKQDGYPIFFTGDFNSGYQVKTGNRGNPTYQGKAENLTYCIMTKDNFMYDAYDLSLNRQAKCPNPGKDYIDHLFVTNDVKVAKFSTASPPGNGSDVHDTMIFDVIIPSTGNGGSSSTTNASGSWNWPVDKKWWDNYKADFLGPHTMISGTFTSPYAKGVADDISTPPIGTPEYSMLDGKVIRTNLCGLGDGMMIESNIQGGKLDIAYGHGLSPKFKVGDSVKGGQQILSLNGVGCKVYGAHLHIDMSFNGKHICPQDVFIAMGNGQTPDLASLTSKGVAPCGR